VVDRKTSSTIYVPQAAVSIIGGIQPDTLRRYVGQEQRDNGLLARLVLTMPPRRAKQWTEADIDPASEETIRQIFEALFALEPAKTPEGDPRPGVVPLKSDGKAAWVAFYNEHNQEQVELTGDLAAAWSKLEGYAARFALVHHLVRQVVADLAKAGTIDRSAVSPTTGGIDANSIEAGVILSRWFAHEARRVYAMLDEDDEAREHRRLTELIERHDGAVSVRDWQRIRTHRTAADARAELDGFVEAGLGAWQNQSAGPKGGRPSPHFVLNARTGAASAASEHPERADPREQLALVGAGAESADSEWGEL
jgi:hypothetical protein